LERHRLEAGAKPDPGGAGSDNDLFSVAATSHSDAWAVGEPRLAAVDLAVLFLSVIGGSQGVRCLSGYWVDAGEKRWQQDSHGWSEDVKERPRIAQALRTWSPPRRTRPHRGTRLAAVRAWTVSAAAAPLILGMAAGTTNASAHQGSGGRRLAPPSAVAAHRHAGLHRKMQPRPQGALGSGNLINHGGPVESAPRVYVVYWGWTSDPSGEQAYLNRFLSSVGSTSWLATVGQYGGGSAGNLLAGTWSDPSSIPASPSDAQIQAEAANAINHFGTGTSVNVEIVVATPTGHSTPGFGSQFCAYHGAVSAHPNVTYTDLPYMTDAGTSCGEDSVNGSSGTLDGVSIVEGHELAETITDPLLNAWYDSSGFEIGDKCAWTNLADITTSAGAFAVQPLWSNAVSGCALASRSASQLSAGQTMSAGQKLVSPNGNYTLAMQTDGNLAEYGPSGVIWATNTTGSGNHVSMQTDGNLVIYNSAGTALWQSGTAGHPAPMFALQNDSNLVIYLPAGATWAKTSSLTSGLPNTLTAGQSIHSPNGTYQLVMQTDGNLVEYGPSGAIWATGTGGTGSNNKATMQTDGNLVVYNSAGKALWASGTGGHSGAQAHFTLDLQNDSNLVIYWPPGVLWHR
jgi:hypothetical protein